MTSHKTSARYLKLVVSEDAKQKLINIPRLESKMNVMSSAQFRGIKLSSKKDTETKRAKNKGNGNPAAESLRRQNIPQVATTARYSNRGNALHSDG